MGLALLISIATAPAQDSPSEVQELRNALRMEGMGLDSDLAKMEEQWPELEKQLTNAAHVKIRAGKVSRWSVGQQTMHIAKVINGIGMQIQGLLSDATIGAKDEANPFGTRVLSGGAIPRGAGKAPSSVAVHYQPTLDQIKAELKAARATWAKVAERKAEVAASPSKYPHFALGPMTSAEWTRFIAIHTAHHLKIIDDILANAAARKK